MQFPDDMPVAEARAAFFAQNGFAGDGGYAGRWLPVNFGRLSVPFPNTRGRARALPLHDLHHLATGYATSVVGEAEISAWELAAGVGCEHTARYLHWCSLSSGLVLAPRRTWRAFVRGYGARTLYEVDLARLLASSVGELRARCARASERRAPIVAAFVLSAAASVVASVLTVLAAIPLFFARALDRA